MSPMWRMMRMGWLYHCIKRFNWCANNWAALLRRQWASSWGNSSVWRTQRFPWNPWRVQVIRSSNRVCHLAWPTRKIESPTMQSLSLRKMWNLRRDFWQAFSYLFLRSFVACRHPTSEFFLVVFFVYVNVKIVVREGWINFHWGDGGWSHYRRTLLHSLSSRREGISYWSQSHQSLRRKLTPFWHTPQYRLSSEVLAVTKNSGLHDFAFDAVFGERSGQPKVYEEAARRLVMEFLNGTSASIICCSIFLQEV